MKRKTINTALLLAIVFFLAGNIYVLIRPAPKIPNVSDKEIHRVPQPPAPTGAIQFNIAGLRDGFSRPRPPIPPSSSTLLGVVLHGNRRFAIVQEKGKATDVLQEGSELDKMRVRKIAPEGLILEGDNGAEKVKVFPDD